MATILVILVIMYFLPVYVNYKYLQKAFYHEQGRFKGCKPDVDDLVVMLTPFLNIVMSFSFMFGLWKNDEYRGNTIEKFFKPKN